VWHELELGYGFFVRAMADCFCQVYQLSPHLWRWEVLRWRPRTGRYSLERLGTRPELLQAIAAAEGYVEASQNPAPS
jgi:hypothetical protein